MKITGNTFTKQFISFLKKKIWVFLSCTFKIHRKIGKGGGYLCNSSLPLSPVSQTLRYWPDNYCRDLTSGHIWQPDLNQEPVVSKLCVLSIDNTEMKRGWDIPFFQLHQYKLSTRVLYNLR